MAPYHNRLKDGVEPSKAWDQSKDEMDQGARYGTWKKDFFLSKLDDSGQFCHAMEIRSELLLRPGRYTQTHSGVHRSCPNGMTGHGVLPTAEILCLCIICMHNGGVHCAQHVGTIMHGSISVLVAGADHGSVCRGVLQELESVVTRARHFQFKPDGEVTFMMAQDAVGLPAPLMQVCLAAPRVKSCRLKLPSQLPLRGLARLTKSSETQAVAVDASCHACSLFWRIYAL